MININNIINAPLITLPWSHKIIDNIFDDKSFEVINKAASHLSHLCISDKTGITGRDFQYPIHDESIYKIINLVTYLQPEDSVGTRLYSGPDKGEFVTQIPWKPNRAALFYPGHRVTWHNWQGQPTNEPRITLNFFVERIEALKDTLYKPGEQENALNSLLWFYEKIGQGRLNINIG